MHMGQPGEDVLECGRRRMTRVVGDVGQPRRMETCGAEEPYEGNLHVRFCGGIGRVIADPTRTMTRSCRTGGIVTVQVVQT